MLYLKKMNLELFKDKNAAPSDSWWERLFNSHGDIAFDDYDKDFTDLPTPIAEVSVLVCLYLLFEHRTDQLHCARHSPSQPPKMRQVYCRREKRKNIRSAKPHANVMTCGRGRKGRGRSEGGVEKEWRRSAGGSEGWSGGLRNVRQRVIVRGAG